eukprot:scaffold5584_cov76-Cyclotella_meneghiniana.AAC.16
MGLELKELRLTVLFRQRDNTYFARMVGDQIKVRERPLFHRTTRPPRRSRVKREERDHLLINDSQQAPAGPAASSQLTVNYHTA